MAKRDKLVVLVCMKPLGIVKYNPYLNQQCSMDLCKPCYQLIESCNLYQLQNQMLLIANYDHKQNTLIGHSKIGMLFQLHICNQCKQAKSGQKQWNKVQ
jgi:hypothetical protein